MAKHSHWANIKHKKGVNDARKAKVIARMGKLITVAVQIAGPTPEENPRLRLAMAKARSAQMNNEAIERAIRKAAGDSVAGRHVDEVTYEGYAPGGVAVVVSTFTDNRNRTAPEIKKLFERAGGAVGAPGCVAWQFKDKALFLVDTPSEDAVIEALLAGDADAEEFIVDGGQVSVSADPAQFDAITRALTAAKLGIASSELAKIPDHSVSVSQPAQIQALRDLVDALEEHEDVQDVSHNAELPD